MPRGVVVSYAPRVPTVKLLDVAPVEKVIRSKCRDLVPLDRSRCARCGAPVEPEVHGKLSLLRHGGYGADEETTYSVCSSAACRYTCRVQVIETNPRRR